MHVLVAGGSGFLGGLVLPLLAQHHTLRILDLQPPLDPSWDYVAGSVTEADAWHSATTGMEVLIYMAMGAKHFDSRTAISTNFDVNVKGLYVGLRAAAAAGIPHAVYTSSMSVYAGELTERYFPNEDVVPDADHFYGLTKRFGEEVCASAVRTTGMSINALRLCFPTADAEWRTTTHRGVPTLATAASDVAAALLAAIEYRAGFQPFMISGDYEQHFLNMAKARDLLGWEPRVRPDQ